MTLLDWEWADLIDDLDQVKMLVRLDSEYSQNCARAMNRRIDRQIITALNAASVSVAGTDATSDITLASFDSGNNVIANGGTNLTLAKVRTTVRRFDLFDVDEEDRVFVISPAGMSALLTDSQVTSSDFNTIKALIEGRLPAGTRWMGMNWIQSTLLPISGNVRSCFAFQKLGMGLAIGRDVTPRIDEIPTKGYSTQVFANMSIEAVRIEEARVVQIDIDETA